MVLSNPSEGANIGMGICRSVTGSPPTMMSNVIASCRELRLRLLIRWCFIATLSIQCFSVYQAPRGAFSFFAARLLSR